MKKFIFKLVGTLIVGAIVCMFIYPEEGKYYEGFFLGWLAPCTHGGTFLINYFLSFFIEGRLIKATSHSGAYNFWWWLSAIGSAVSIIIQLFGVFLNLIKSKKK